MADLGTVLESSVGPNRDQDSSVRLLKATIATPKDVQTLQLIGGIDQSPVPGSQMLVLEIGASWKIAIPLTDGVDPSAETGAKYLYSQDENGSIQSTFKLRSDGTIEINGSSDFAVAFNDLKTGFDSLSSQVSANLTAIATAITSLGGVYTVIPLTASIDASKVETVKLP